MVEDEIPLVAAGMVSNISRGSIQRATKHREVKWCRGTLDYYYFSDFLNQDVVKKL